MSVEINTLIADARRRLRHAGIPAEEAALDARLLAQHALGWDGTRLLTHGESAPPAGFDRDYEALVARRAGREPLAYITGSREFWQLTIQVSPGVLIPRPETELLVESALDHCDRRSALRIADVGTGTACVAIALAREFPRALIAATDISPDALQVARRNVAQHDLSARIRCVRADLLPSLPGSLDLIVANPPYVPVTDAQGLQPEVRDFEPPWALFGGEDGLQIVRRLIAETPVMLASGGILMFEIGAGQHRAVTALVDAAPNLELLEWRNDLQDIPRVAIARKTSPSPR
ncbi:MAG: peptide chain release factor N(5)-glutamine methyltransferase [Vicinamibacterales bacterium]